MLLPDDLQSISNTAAHNARIREGRGCGYYVRYLRLLKDEHAHPGYYGRHDELHERQLHAVDVLAGVVVYYHYLYRIEYRASEGESVAGIDRGKVLGVDADEEESDQAECYGQPDDEADLLPEDYREQRHKEHIERGDERDLAGSGVIKSELLKVLRDGKDDA